MFKCIHSLIMFKWKTFRYFLFVFLFFYLFDNFSNDLNILLLKVYQKHIIHMFIVRIQIIKNSFCDLLLNRILWNTRFTFFFISEYCAGYGILINLYRKQYSSSKWIWIFNEIFFHFFILNFFLNDNIFVDAPIRVVELPMVFTRLKIGKIYWRQCDGCWLLTGTVKCFFLSSLYFCYSCLWMVAGEVHGAHCKHSVYNSDSNNWNE